MNERNLADKPSDALLALRAWIIKDWETFGSLSTDKPAKYICNVLFYSMTYGETASITKQAATQCRDHIYELMNPSPDHSVTSLSRWMHYEGCSVKAIQDMWNNQAAYSQKFVEYKLAWIDDMISFWKEQGL